MKHWLFIKTLNCEMFIDQKVYKTKTNLVTNRIKINT